jgi:hypothetical protein
LTKKLAVVALLMIGCESVSSARKEVSALQAEADQQRATNFELSNRQEKLHDDIKAKQDELLKLYQDSDILAAEKAQKSVHYVLHVSIRQVSYSLSLSKQLRDAVNAEEFDLPTDKVTYDHANPGDDLFDSFRAGSAIFRGSLGSWRIKVVGKRVQIDK